MMDVCRRDRLRQFWMRLRQTTTQRLGYR